MERTRKKDQWDAYWDGMGTKVAWSFALAFSLLSFYLLWVCISAPDTADSMRLAYEIGWCLLMGLSPWVYLAQLHAQKYGKEIK